MVRKIAVIAAFATLAPTLAFACKAHEKQAAAAGKDEAKIQLAQNTAAPKVDIQNKHVHKPAPKEAAVEAKPEGATAQMATDAGTAATTAATGAKKSKPSAKDVSAPQAAPTK